MFFLKRGTSGAEVNASWPSDRPADIRGGTQSDEPEDSADDKTDEPINSDRAEPATDTGDYQLPSPHHLIPTPTSLPCCPLLPPRADLLTPDQAGQLHQELLAGREVPEGLPKSITHVLVLGDTGCATSMGNSKDHFKAGSIVASESKVIGVSGPMTIGERGNFRFPMVTISHGIK
eukprot:4820108-Prymnesium_polylepis.1